MQHIPLRRSAVAEKCVQESIVVETEAGEVASFAIASFFENWIQTISSVKELRFMCGSCDS